MVSNHAALLPPHARTHRYASVSLSVQPQNSERASSVYRTVPPLYHSAAPSMLSRAALMSPPAEQDRRTEGAQ